MIRTIVVCLVCLSFASAIAAAADEPYRPVPMIKAVEPDTVKAGAELTATGTHLDKSAVANLYIIQGEKTIQVKITTQAEETIKFTTPADVKPGRYQLMVLTTGSKPQFLEEPVYLNIE
jgi:IPT/TIG domain